MPSRETVLLVVFAAIVVNLILAGGLLVVPRFRRRMARRSVTEIGAGGSGPSAAETSPGSPRAVSKLQADPETGLDTVAAWTRWLADEDARVRRYGRRATIVLVAVEGLDRMARHLGVEPTAPLIPVVTNLREHAREADRLARLGPSKFGILLPETDEIQAINYVERVSGACDQWLESGSLALRLSIGWAEVNEARGMHAAIALAEDRLVTERRRSVFGEPDYRPIDPAPAAA